MKKSIIILLSALLLLPTAVLGQYKIVVKHSNGQENSVMDVWDVEDITFEKIDPQELEDAAIPQPVDLGLTVNWANVNLGAKSAKDAGWLIGWGDATAKNVSTSLKWYPAEMPPSTIANSDNDILKFYYGEPWRLPTDEELQELISECTWTYVEREDSVGFVVKSTKDGYTDKYIFLPASGFRDGSTIQSSANYYWTGMLSTENNETAKALSVVKGTEDGTAVTPTLLDVKRYMGCALRAVNGELKVNVGIEASAVASEDYFSSKSTEYSVDLQLTGSYDSYSELEHGVFYGTNSDLSVEANRQKAFETVVSADGKTTIKLTGLTPYSTYYFIPYVVVRGQTICENTVYHFFTPRFDEPEIVDMGLSVKWASFNVGATSIYEKGNYIGWGDPTGLMTSNISSDYARGNTSSDIGGIKDYDVAQATWGKKWRMPTRAHFEELFDETKCSITTSAFGVTFTSKTTGKSITLPYAGAINSNGDLRNETYMYYWTSEYYEGGFPYCIMYPYGINYSILQTVGKSTRMSIRAVYDENEDNGGETEKEPEKAEAGNAVDLGLSVKWADRNVGYTSAKPYGEYFTWADTLERASWTMTDYIHYNPSDYNSFTYLGTNENHWSSYSICGTEYDVARRRWGGTWRLPTRNEINELMDYCTWTWSARDGGVMGYEVSRNGRTIFFPAGGNKSLTTTNKLGEKGYYWTGDIANTLQATANTEAWTLEFSNTSKEESFEARTKALLIRPVQ